jgi:LPS O-antigen subunit length determinant protein (WzzB/FepE family)
MARGWESKAVADQIEEADERALRQASLDNLSPEERARRDRLESLRLSRTRTLTQLEQATRPAHRQMLQRTLRALEAEIEELRDADKMEKE